MSRRLLAIALLAAGAAAQTWTSCQPLNTTCPPNPAHGTTYAVNFTAATTELDPRFWNITSGASLISFSDNGANLAMGNAQDTITVQSNFYIMFGQMEIIMRAAPGAGVISTGILISDDLDEIDWEIIGNNNTFVENNWYGWGKTHVAAYVPLAGAADGFHNYTIDWNAERIEYIIDGNVMRTVPYNVPGLYPQTPMQMRFGIWPAGESSQPGTVEWAGGKCDWSQGPFVMDVKSIRITDGTTNVTDYTYDNHSGAWQSIVGTAGESEAYRQMHSLSTAQKVQQGFDKLPLAAKIGIGCGALAVFLIGFTVFAVYFTKQRRAGRAERAIADREWEQHTNELATYHQMMARGQFAVQHMGHGEKF